MNNSDVLKYKSKKYYIKQAVNKKLTIELNLKGFLCSCNGREKECTKEAYNLLNEYADKLYPPVENFEGTKNLQEQDISESLNKELLGLKQVPLNKKRFQLVESGAKNFLFIKTTLQDTVELVKSIVKDIYENKTQKTRFLLRLIPIEITCKASVNDIVNAFLQIAEKHFINSSETFCVAFNHRNNNVLPRDDVIKAIADKVLEIRPDYKVDLKGAKLTVIIEVIKGYAFLSIISDYFKYKKYNLLSICN